MTMMVTVFRSRVRPEVQAEYLTWVTRMNELAKAERSNSFRR